MQTSTSAHIFVVPNVFTTPTSGAKGCSILFTIVLCVEGQISSVANSQPALSATDCPSSCDPILIESIDTSGSA